MRQGNLIEDMTTGIVLARTKLSKLMNSQAITLQGENNGE